MFFKLPNIYVELPTSQALMKVFFKAFIPFSQSPVTWEFSRSITRDNNGGSSCLSHWPLLSPPDPHNTPPHPTPVSLQVKGFRKESSMQSWKLACGTDMLRPDLVIFFLQPVKAYFWGWWRQWLQNPLRPRKDPAWPEVGRSSTKGWMGWNGPEAWSPEAARHGGYANP